MLWRFWCSVSACGSSEQSCATVVMPVRYWRIKNKAMLVESISITERCTHLPPPHVGCYRIFLHSMMKVQSFDASSEFGVLQRSNTLLSLSASTHCWTFYRYTHISTSGMHWCSKIKFVNIWNIAPIQFIESANPMFFFFLRPLIDQCRTSSTHAVIKAWSGKLFQDTHARVSMFMMTEGQVYVSTSAGSSLHFLPGMIQMNTQKCTLPESLTLTSVDNLTSVL